MEYLIHYAEKGMINVHNPISKDEVQIFSQIGKGAVGTVYKVSHLVITKELKLQGIWKGKDVAVKVFNPNGLSFVESEFRREVAIGNMRVDQI